MAAQWGVADVGLVELLRVPLLAGRTFTSADGSDVPPVAVINETLARRLWLGESPREVLGREELSAIDPNVAFERPTLP